MINMKNHLRFDSKFEEEVYKALNCEYHPSDRIQYKIPKTYEPDFVYRCNGWRILIEVKGRFRTSEEARKYVYVAEKLTSKEKLVFLFQRPTTPMPGSRKRKDGTRYTMAEWADKKGFKWYTIDTVPKGWRR